MALVAYDSEFSDSDEEVEDSNELNDNVNITSAPVDRVNAESSISLFNSLPMPKQSAAKLLNDEEEDEFLRKKAIPSEELPKATHSHPKNQRKPARITLPSLANFENDEEESTVTKFKPSVKGTGLLSLLPQPKSTPNKESFKKFIPHVIADKSAQLKKAQIAKYEKKLPQKKISLINNYGSSDESDTEERDTGKPVDFFSLNDDPSDHIELSQVPFVDDTLTNVFPSVPNNIATRVLPTESEAIQPEPIYYDQQLEANASTSDNLDIDSEVLKKLCGSRARHKGENMQIIDINQKEIMPDPREWLTKALTEDNSKRMSSSKRRGDEPTTQQRRKHQITYLAHQAKMNEHELQSQWANNRLTKKQTQSKYGF